MIFFTSRNLRKYIEARDWSRAFVELACFTSLPILHTMLHASSPMFAPCFTCIIVTHCLGFKPPVILAMSLHRLWCWLTWCHVQPGCPDVKLLDRNVLCWCGMHCFHHSTACCSLVLVVWAACGMVSSFSLQYGMPQDLTIHHIGKLEFNRIGEFLRRSLMQWIWYVSSPLFLSTH